MEDSGIDSEDRQSATFDELLMRTAAGGANTKQLSDLDFEVAFRGASDASASKALPSGIDTNEKVVLRAEPPNTCRILQRKLELKVERAKRNYSQYQEEQSVKSQSANLIPISRLPIPGASEHKPLVDYKSASSDDDAEEISFFPAKLKHAKHQKNTELTDTFSIQEMTIDSDLDSDDSAGTQNLELLLPQMKTNFLDKFRSCFGCVHGS